MAARFWLWLGLSAVVACDGEETEVTPEPPLFPEDYAESYTEVRDCRQSGDHDLNLIRILADPSALSPYQNRDAPIPVGGVLLKEEYDFGDASCAGPIKQWTVMERLEVDSSPEALDWRWQQVDAARNIVGEDTPRCYGCHTGCTDDAGGYENTCAVP